MRRREVPAVQWPEPASDQLSKKPLENREAKSVLCGYGVGMIVVQDALTGWHAKVLPDAFSASIALERLQAV